jgi:hypothetical protein
MKLEMFDRDVEVSDEFIAWYKKFDPSGWDCEYSGNIYGLWMAWEAGRKFTALDRIEVKGDEHERESK